MSAPRIDVISIFPTYLAPLDLSLIGKARENGLVDLRVHDLREVTTDRHRTVDDSPFGGGAGMVMRPDVWARAVAATATHGLDAEAEPDAREVVVLVPTPSGAPLTQPTAQALADELSRPDVRAVIACGRYEGIDARLMTRLAQTPGIRAVREFSLGDYVLNGGEVASLVLLEAVVRLLPGVLGNPESVVEESFAGDGLLEYPVYTRPADWEGEAVPAVLTSGDHQAVARWRRARSLERTARRRPELLRALDPATLTRGELEVLAQEGVIVGNHGRLLGPLRVRRGVPADASAVAELAAVTFALACPDATTLADVRAHVGRTLSVQAFAGWLADPERDVVLLEDPASGELLGYSMLVAGEQGGDAPPSDAVDAALGSRGDRVGPRTLVELSKCYTLPRVQGTGAARTLMAAMLAIAGERGADAVWLGVNGENAAAGTFYRRQGFVTAGERTYRVGEVDHRDDVLVVGLERGVAD